MDRMKTEQIIIANLKCSGCAGTIEREIMTMPGVKTVDVNHDEDSVKIQFEGDLNREDFTKKLYSLGYPEATEENGLLLKLKSYISCATGKINNRIAG